MGTFRLPGILLELLRVAKKPDAMNTKLFDALLAPHLEQATRNAVRDYDEYRRSFCRKLFGHPVPNTESEEGLLAGYEQELANFLALHPHMSIPTAVSEFLKKF